MATQIFFRTGSAGAPYRYSTGTNNVKLNGSASSWTPLALATTRGAGASNAGVATVAGPTNGIEVGSGGTPIAFYSAPLAADVTISGSITWNLRAFEDNMSANAAINARLEVVDGATGAITLIDQTARVTELVVGTETAENFAETPAAGIACKKGDRLRVRVFADDAGTMGSGFNVTFGYDGPTAGAAGDSYFTLTENLTFITTDPTTTQIFPTDTASDVATAAVDREAWTSRGAGVQTDVTNTAAGWTAPIQVTDTAGGTVVDWFTKQLAAFTIGDAVLCNIRAAESNTAANAVVRVEVAVCDADGTGCTTWAQNSMPTELTTSEVAQQFYVSGDDLAVTDGQRLRLRLLIDDFAFAAMASGHTVTTYYAGTSGGASGDTYLTFTNTLTEAASGTTANAGVATGTGAAI